MTFLPSFLDLHITGSSITNEDLISFGLEANDYHIRIRNALFRNNF